MTTTFSSDPATRMQQYIDLKGDWDADETDVCFVPRETLVSYYLNSFNQPYIHRYLVGVCQQLQKLQLHPEIVEMIQSQPQPYDQLTLMLFVERPELSNDDIAVFGF